ncbi:MAG TPA: hypothetical protein VGY99_19005 [Candidatus Binataceae bacterium]|jgi:hypothetical protein|nr:hypothetical protein [Candidatus Binataceae bacterium]
MPAFPAEQSQPRDHVIAGLEIGNLAAHRLDNPGGFVTENHRRRHRNLALGDRQVAVADAGGYGADQHLIAAGLVDVHFLKGLGLAGLVKNGGLHRGLLMILSEPVRLSTP